MFNYETVENFTTVWTYLTSQETALKFMRIFCFQKPLWLYNLFPKAQVRVFALKEFIMIK